MRGVNDAAPGRAFGRPDREYPTEKEQIAYRTGFYAELEVIDDGEGGREKAQAQGHREYLSPPRRPR